MHSVYLLFLLRSLSLAHVSVIFLPRVPNRKRSQSVLKYEVSSLRSYIPVRASVSSLRLDIKNSAEEKWSRQSCQVADMIIQPESICALSVGRRFVCDVEYRNGCQETQARSTLYQSRACDYRDILITDFIVLRACRIRSLVYLMPLATTLSPFPVHHDQHLQLVYPLRYYLPPHDFIQPPLSLTAFPQSRQPPSFSCPVHSTTNNSATSPP
jgi:hypothetical protein